MSFWHYFFYLCLTLLSGYFLLSQPSLWMDFPRITSAAVYTPQMNASTFECFKELRLYLLGQTVATLKWCESVVYIWGMLWKHRLLPMLHTSVIYYYMLIANPMSLHFFWASFSIQLLANRWIPKCITPQNKSMLSFNQLYVNTFVQFTESPWRRKK